MTIGWRIMKTGLAVGLTIWIARLLKLEYPLYAAIAALIGLQPTLADSVKQSLDRMKGTVVGAIIGFLFALVMVNNPLWICFGLIVVLGVLKFMKWNEAMNIASVVFIVISLNTKGNPLSFSLNRLLDTAVGLGVAFLVNRFIFPPRYQKDLEDSFQLAREQVISLYSQTFRSIIYEDVTPKDLDKLIQSLKEVRVLVNLNKKERIWASKDENFRQRFIGPLSRLEQMHRVLEHLQELEHLSKKPFGKELLNDLVGLLNRSQSLLALITDPTTNLAANAYEETSQIIDSMHAKLMDDEAGNYAGANQVMILELLGLISEFTKVTGGCLKVPQVSED